MTYLFSKWVCLLYIYVVQQKNAKDMKKKTQANVENNINSVIGNNRPDSFSNPYSQLFSPSYQDNTVEYITENGKVGVRNSQGIVIIPPINDEIIARHIIGYIVRQGEQIGIMLQDGQGTLLAPCIYDDIRFDLSILGFRVVKDGKVGILNMLGEVVIPCELTEIYEMANGLMVVRDGDKYGVYTENGEYVRPEYDDVGEICVGSGPVAVLREEEWGYIEHETHQFVTPEEYENGRENVIFAADI